MKRSNLVVIVCDRCASLCKRVPWARYCGECVKHLRRENSRRWAQKNRDRIRKADRDRYRSKREDRVYMAIQAGHRLAAYYRRKSALEAEAQEIINTNPALRRLKKEMSDGH